MKSIITLQLVCKTWIIKKLLSKTTENKETNKQTNQNTINKNKTYTIFNRVKCARFIYFISGIVFIDDDLLSFSQLILAV